MEFFIFKFGDTRVSVVIDRTTGLNIFQQTNTEPAMATASNTRACAGSPTVAHTQSCTTLRMSQAHEHENHSFSGHSFRCHSFTGYTGTNGTGVGGR